MRRKNENGITLVALVITIVILLVLAGISISTLTNTGIFEKVKDAKKKSEDAQKEQDEMLYKYEDELSKFTSDDRWDGKVNKPELMTGMTAIQFTEPTADTAGSVVKVSDSSKNDWYNYDAQKWANAQTEDGSMWVWIPRYAYKVVYNDPNDKSKGGVFDIVFLIGTTDNYIDENGNIQTAQRQTSRDQVIITDSTKTDKYTVHPAFTNESNIDYVNGGWKKELAGIWVAKFEAGYFDKETEKDKIKESSVKYSQSYGYTPNLKNEESRNYYDGIYGKKITAIKYPTFQGQRYSFNYINQSDAFSLSRVLTEEGNVYGLNKNSTDSHLMKNSEWGIVVYLSQSKYGVNNTRVRINNVNVRDNEKFVYSVTGYSAKDDGADWNDEDNSYKWTEINGAYASCTGTIYGIYDLVGGGYERIAAMINNKNDNINRYSKVIIDSLNNGKSTPYVTVYPTVEITGDFVGNVNSGNYKIDTRIYGDAIRETSTDGLGCTAWNSELSYFPGYNSPTFIRRRSIW